MRIAIGIEYDGRGFAGWETQVGQPTVQACLESALTEVADEAVKTVCAGRTDAGVHATGQVAHFDTNAPRPLQAWVFGVNANLPGSVGVIWSRPVDDSFHARFNALSRHYRYVILNRRVRPALLAGRVGWEYRPLDAPRMHTAAQSLLGEHDFSAFRASSCQAKSPVRTIFRLDVVREGAFILIDVVANAFLHHMVRNLVGSLVSVGLGKHEPGWLTGLIEARDRRRAAATMPADGLYLVGVKYPDRLEIPALPPILGLW